MLGTLVGVYTYVLPLLLFTIPLAWPLTDEVKNPDSDPMDEMGHGTHVAGIIAGSKGLYVLYSAKIAFLLLS